MSSISSLLGINYYYPAGEHFLTRIRFTKIEREATVSQLMYQIQKELPHPAPLGLFKVSFEWADIQAGTDNRTVSTFVYKSPHSTQRRPRAVEPQQTHHGSPTLRNHYRNSLSHILQHSGHFDG